MNAKRFTVFLLVVAIMLVTAGATAPWLVPKIRLGLDLKGGFEILYVASPMDEDGVITRDDLREAAKNLKKRVDSEGIAEPDITPEGEDRIRVRLAGVTDQTALREKLKEPSILTFRAPDGTIEMDGRDFVPGGAAIQYKNGTHPIVEIRLKDAAKFKDITTRLLNQTLAIYMDETLISNPGISNVIDSDTAVIEGNFTYQEANDLKNKINLGALPLKLTEKYTQSVDASLGKAALDKTMYAGILAFILILLFMLFFYRVPGMVAVVTLLFYTWLVILVFVLMNATLTLPGIAAMVLGIGMAVDANIITNERIKEELRSGKSILSAVRAGSKSSFRTIMDANLTTIIAAGVLYIIGTGAIKGFALTLIFSILISIFTNVFVSRILLQLLVRSNVVKKPGYFGVKEEQIREL